MDFIRNIFLYNPNEPFLFTNMAFWIFFTTAYLIFAIAHRNIPVRNNLLFLLSLFFYYKTGGLYVLLLIFSILLNYSLAFAIARTFKKMQRKLLLIAGVAVNLAMLFYYKYTYLLVDWFNGITGSKIKVHDYFAVWGNSFFNSSWDIASIILPVGISFFTFQALSYVIDVYRNKITPLKSLTGFGFFYFLFPSTGCRPNNQSYRVYTADK